jgi:drug/metabolite transporter (DMT)-like permease
MPPTAVSMSGSNWLLLVVLSILWGAAFFFNKIVVGEIPPLTGALGRVGFAAIFLIALAQFTNVPLAAPLREWRAFLLLGLLHNVLPFSLILWGQIRVGSGLAAILNAMTLSSPLPSRISRPTTTSSPAHASSG